MKFGSLLLLLPLLVVVGCGKSSSTAIGEDMIRYQQEDYIDLNEDESFFEGRIYVENAEPYRDIMGDLMADAWATDINGNGVQMTGLELSNCAPSEIKWLIGDNADSLLLYLESSRLLLKNRFNESEPILLGEMILVDVANRIVRFAPVENDLSGYLEINRPDEMYFEYKLRDVWQRQGQLPVKYEILFGYEYQYEESEP